MSSLDKLQEALSADRHAMAILKIIKGSFDLAAFADCEKHESFLIIMRTQIEELLDYLSSIHDTAFYSKLTKELGIPELNNPYLRLDNLKSLPSDGLLEHEIYLLEKAIAKSKKGDHAMVDAYLLVIVGIYDEYRNNTSVSVVPGFSLASTDDGVMAYVADGNTSISFIEFHVNNNRVSLEGFSGRPLYLPFELLRGIYRQAIAYGMKS